MLPSGCLLNLRSLSYLGSLQIHSSSCKNTLAYKKPDAQSEHNSLIPQRICKEAQVLDAILDDELVE